MHCQRCLKANEDVSTTSDCLAHVLGIKKAEYSSRSARGIIHRVRTNSECSCTRDPLSVVHSRITSELFMGASSLHVRMDELKEQLAVLRRSACATVVGWSGPAKYWALAKEDSWRISK